MPAEGKRGRPWTREGGPFDILAIAVAVIVIAGGFFIVNLSSLKYRTQGAPVVSAVPVIAPIVVPEVAPRQ